MLSEILHCFLCSLGIVFLANRGSNYVNVEDALDVIRGFSFDACEECSSPASGHGLTGGRILFDCLIGCVFTKEIHEGIMCFLFSLGIINLSKVLSECLFLDGSRRLDSDRGRSFCGRYGAAARGSVTMRAMVARRLRAFFNIW